MGDREDGLGKAMRVGGMNIAPDHIVAHETIDDISTFTVGCAEHQGMPKQVSFIDECVGADTLALAKIFEGMIRVERVSPNLELLPVTGGMNFILRPTV